MKPCRENSRPIKADIIQKESLKHLGLFSLKVSFQKCCKLFLFICLRGQLASGHKSQDRQAATATLPLPPLLPKGEGERAPLVTGLETLSKDDDTNKNTTLKINKC